MWHLFSFFSSDFCYFITRIFFFFFFWAWKWPTSQWRQLKATISHRFNFWYNFVCVIDTRGPHWKKWNSSKSPTIDEKERRDEHLGLFHCVTDVVERESGCPACCVWSKKEKGIEKDTWALWLDPLSQFSLLYPRNANHNVLRRQPCITNDKKKPWEYIRRRGREYFAHKVPSLSLSSFLGLFEHLQDLAPPRRDTRATPKAKKENAKSWLREFYKWVYCVVVQKYNQRPRRRRHTQKKWCENVQSKNGITVFSKI